MSTENNYINRFPVICSAGKKSEKSEPVESLLKNYSPANFAEILVNRKDDENLRAAREADSYIERVVYKENMKGILELTESSFRTFEKKLMESLFQKRHPLGKARPVYCKPAHVTNESTTFGMPSVKSDDLYEVVLPAKKHEEVLKETQAGHTNYIRSHGDYNPSEKVHRGYDPSSFDSNMAFGMKIDLDQSGVQVKRIMKSCYQPADVCFLRTTQDDVNKRTKFTLGKPLNKTHVCSQFSRDFTYGIKTLRPKFNVKGLIYGKSVCNERLVLYKAIAHINVIRRYLKRTSPTTTYLLDIRDDFNNCEGESCTWQRFFEVMSKYYIPLSETKAKLIATHFKILDDNNPNNVKYMKLMDFLDIFIPLPEIGMLDNFPQIDNEKLTTYREMTNNFQQDDKNCTADPAGSVIGQLPSQYCMADLDSLPYETSVKAIISPAIPTHYGLSHRDYLLPRNKEYIRNLFKKGQDSLSDIDFEKYWEEAKKEWSSNDDMVSIEAFFYSMRKNKK